MIRSLYSGVAGLKTQQTKMDVIGNNIANVGTYGFKSDRATFKDVYYQTTSTASASTGNVGGTNAKQIGYGNLVGSIDTNTKTSAMSSTGYGLDIAIAGEGFLQVMGADGNIMYTKAGMLDIDAEGNLVDVNGNFVLGISGSDTTLPPASNKIQVTLPFLDAQTASVESTINNVEYTITSANQTDKANANFNFLSSVSMPIGQKMMAKISGDSITVTVNANEEFSGIDEINAELNKAIKAANGGVEHPAGDFTISMVPERTKFQALDIDTSKPASAIKLTGAELVSSDFGYIPGEIDMHQGLRSLFSIKSVGESFKGDTRNTKFDTNPVEYSAANVASAGTGSLTIQLTDVLDNTNTVNAVYTDADLKKMLPEYNTAANADNFTLGDSSYNAVTEKLTVTGTASQDFEFTIDDLMAMAYPSVPSGVTSNDVAVSGNVTQNAVTNDYEFKFTATDNTVTPPVNTNHTVSFSEAELKSMMPNLDSVDLANTTFTLDTANNKGTITIAGNVTKEFGVDMDALRSKASVPGNTAQTFSIDYDEKKGVTVTMKDDNGNEYMGTIANAELKSAGDVLMTRVDKSGKSIDTADSFVLSYPSLATMKNSFSEVARKNSDATYTYMKNPNGEITSFNFTFDNAVEMTQSEPSRSLGLGQTSFKLTGGTEGGEQTVANLTSISINESGRVVGTHDIYGIVELGRIDLATFSNPAGLQKVGNSYFTTSLNSGDPVIVEAGTQGTGQIMASTLEASNVDLSNEFSDMIMTQRGFQASSRVITVSDTMLEELINLKR